MDSSLPTSFAVVLLSFLIIGARPAAATDEIPVVGLNAHGESQIAYYSSENYAEGVSRMISASYQETISELNRREETHPGWPLVELQLGVGLDASIGLSPFFRLDLAPGINLEFTKDAIPVGP